MVNRRGRCIRRSAPAYYGNLVGLMTRKNRHLAEWRFFVKYRRDAWVPPYGETDSHASDTVTGSE